MWAKLSFFGSKFNVTWYCYLKLLEACHQIKMIHGTTTTVANFSWSNVHFSTVSLLAVSVSGSDKQPLVVKFTPPSHGVLSKIYLQCFTVISFQWTNSGFVFLDIFFIDLNLVITGIGRVWQDRSLQSGAVAHDEAARNFLRHSITTEYSLRENTVSAFFNKLSSKKK